MLLLTTTGRRSGKRRTTPLGYFADEGRYVIVGSNAGFNYHPAWYHNIKANPRVTIQVKDKALNATAEVAEPAERQRLWDKLMTIAPLYGGYEKQTKREIPLVVLHPDK